VIKHERIHQPIPCTGCGQMLDSAGGINDDTRPPIDGDHVVCIGCGQLMEYKMEVSLIEANIDDLPEENRAGLLEMQAAVKLVNEARADS